MGGNDLLGPGERIEGVVHRPPKDRSRTHRPSDATPALWHGGRLGRSYGAQCSGERSSSWGSSTNTSAAMSGSKHTWDMKPITLRPVAASTASEKRSRIASWKTL